jgi:hypothetical protein
MNWLAVAGAILALIGIASGVGAARRWGTRRGRLAISHELSPLLSANGLADLRVTYKGRTVKDPHLLSVSIKNVGSRNIRRDQFNGDEPWTISFACKLFGVTASKSSGEDVVPVELSVIGDALTLRVPPTIIPRGREWNLELVVSGSDLEFRKSDLADVDVVSVDAAGLQARQEILRAAIGGVGNPFALLTDVILGRSSR